MTHFHGNTALKVDPIYYPGTVGELLTVRAPSSEFTHLVRLNEKLQMQCGEDFSVQCWSGDEISRIPNSVLRSLARCYAGVFNESWSEDWTEETAMAEVRKCIDAPRGYMPVMTMLFKEDEVVGFCWAFIMETDSLTEESAPFSSSSVKRHESVSVARYWLDSVGRKNRLVSIRELGVIKEHRQDKTPYLTIPIFEKAKATDCNVAFFRTKTSSKAFKWSLGVGFVPLQLFMVDDLLLMKGNVKYAMNLLYGSIDDMK
ncbi:MAG TPA: hypothetical protein VMH83_04115, partial [Candidatus Acidoferrum sp.]|nr:hypothetical protein [Candidatus Acidoferrum sp.]